MIPRAPRPSLAHSILIAAITCAGTGALVIACCAGAVRLTGIADEVRQNFRLGFAGVERTPGAAAAIAVQNARIAAAVLLCAVALRWLPDPARAIVDVLLAVVFMLNVVAIGLALGAYGDRLIAATAAHAPIESAALSLSGGTYITARRQPVPTRALACVVVATAALLAGAAAAETYVAGGAS